MNITVKIYWSDDEFRPGVFFCDFHAGWQLWFSLTESMTKGESGPHILRVELWDGGTQLDPKRGYHTSISQQYRKDY